MKKLEIIIRPEKFEDLKKILVDMKVSGMNISNVMGYGNQMGYVEQYRGVVYNVNLVPKMKVEVIIRDAKVDTILARIADVLPTGNVGDGKVFVYECLDAMRIRTGAKGEDAL